MALSSTVALEFIARNRANNQINQFRRSIINTGRTLLTFAGVGGGLYAAKRGFEAIIKSASDAEEISNKFDVVFRDLSAQARRWAIDFGDSVGRSTQDVQMWMAGLQDTFVPLGIARDKAADLSKSLVKLAVDVGSFNNKADAEVIRDFTSALVGNHEAVRKYGIMISESAIKQAALNKNMNKSYKELTDLEKVMLRYAIIQNSTTDAQGDAIRTTDSYANQIKRLNANMTEFKTNLGQLVIGPLADFVSEINKFAEGKGQYAKGLENMSYSLARSFAAARGEQEAWNKATEQYNKLIGKWSTTGLKFEVPTDMESFKILLDIAKGINVETQRFEQFLLRAKGIKATYVGPDFFKYKKPEMPGTEGPAALTSDQLKAIKTQETLIARLNEEIRLQGMLNEPRQHARMMIQFEQSAIAEFGGMTVEAANKIDLFRKKLDELSKAEKWQQMTQTMKSSFADFAESAILDFDNIEEAAKNMVKQIALQLLRLQVINPFAEAISGGIGRIFNPTKAEVQHSGGVVGIGFPPSRMVSTAAFIGARRAHNGLNLAMNEVPIIAEKGETIIPKGAAMAAPSVVINNNTGQNFEAGEPEFDGTNWVVSIIAQNFRQGGSLRKMRG